MRFQQMNEKHYSEMLCPWMFPRSFPGKHKMSV